MEKRQRVILYGDTLVLASVRASLEADPNLEDIALDVRSANEQELPNLHPDVIIFDTSSVQPHFRYAMAQEHSGLLLIGINPDCNQVLVWSGHHLSELSSTDLIQVIDQTLYSIPVSGKKKE